VSALNAEKASLYRDILGTFVAERARFALALRPSEIQAALAAASGPALLPDEVDSALRQLCDWGNLDDSLAEPKRFRAPKAFVKN
jgi:Protein of unknown function (DUF2397)